MPIRLQSLVQSRGHRGAFRDRISAFLEENGHRLSEEEFSNLEVAGKKGHVWSPSGEGRTCWKVLVQIDHERSVDMYIVKEDVSRLAQPTCDHCLYIGKGDGVWAWEPFIYC